MKWKADKACLARGKVYGMEVSENSLELNAGAELLALLRGRHWSPSGLPLPRLHRAAQNENSNCHWAAVSDLNSNNGRTNAWNNLVKSAEIM